LNANSLTTAVAALREDFSLMGMGSLGSLQRLEEELDEETAPKQAGE